MKASVSPRMPRTALAEPTALSHSSERLSRPKNMAAVGLLVVAILLVVTPATPLDSEEECLSRLYGDTVHKLSPSDCTLGDEGGGQLLLFCVIRISVDTPPDPEKVSLSNDSLSDYDAEEKSFNVYIDYRYKLGLYEVGGGTGSSVRCMKIISISYEKLRKDDGQRRLGVSMASSVFNVIANADMLSSSVDLNPPSFVGAADINPECFEPIKRNMSSCIRDVAINFNVSVPGSNENVYKGVVDFSINTFGYSHLSSLNFEYFQPRFRDRTRRGKVLLRHLPGDNITELRLPSNHWSSLSDRDFPRMPKLEIIDLSMNKLMQLKSDIIGESGILKVINFSESQMIAIPPFIEYQPLLSVLDIGGNIFQYSEDSGAAVLYNIGYNLTQITFLNISSFVTKYFERNTLPDLPYLEVLDASKCKIIQIEENSFQNFASLTWIDLSKNNLNSLPARLFAHLWKLEYLDLSSNKIRAGQGLEFFYHKDWPTLGMDYLDMSSNVLESVSDLITPMSKIKQINLANNLLRDLNGIPSLLYGQWVIELDVSSNLISALSEEACNRLDLVEVIHLSENQFDCSSCEIPYFKFWLNTTGREKLSTSPDDIVCTSPSIARKNYVKVINATYYIDACRGPDYELWIGSSFSGLALLASLVGGVLYIYRFEASYVLHMMRVRRRAVKGEGKPHSECIYDAFVSYSGRDRTWVLRVLQPGLEESRQKYQLCLHDRNFTLGGIITQNIVDSIDKSRKTILILSENFVESQWCRWEMEMANHKLFNDSRNFLVLIELERLDRKALPRHLRFLMETRTYLEWPTESPTLLESTITEQPLDVYTETEMKSSTSKTLGRISEQAIANFWRRLQEALGDSLYVKEQKAKIDAKIAIMKTKEREPDVMDMPSLYTQECAEEQESEQL